jgi:hypothetical protein
MNCKLSLDNLATGWITRRVAQWDSNPGLNNALGSIQIEADPVAFKHPVFPPYSAGNEITGFTVLNGKNVALTAGSVQIRWRAFEVERRATTPDGWEMNSRTTLLPDEPGVVVELTLRNSADTCRHLDLALILSGRARNTGTEGYNWVVPEIPTGMFNFRDSEGLAYTIKDTDVPDSRCFVNDLSNAYSIQSVWPTPELWRESRMPTWSVEVEAGGVFRICLLCTYHENCETAVSISKRWHGKENEAFTTSRIKWENLWNAAFTPGNDIFSGSLPVLDTDSDTLKKLYYNGVLTLLTLRRNYAHAVINPAYISLWPRRGEGCVYLSWELPYTSGLLSRLDPAALREMLLLQMSAPELQGQMTNYFNGKHWGWGCCVYPHAIISAGFNLLKQGDDSWFDTEINRRPEGKPVGSMPEIDEDASGYRTLTGRQAFIEMVLAHRKYHLPDSKLVDFGSRHAYHEVLTTYAHGTAGHTAIQAWALGMAMDIMQEDTAVEQDELITEIRGLYRDGEGYFNCQHPDGSRYAAANIYDIGLVLNAIGDKLPANMVDEIESFVLNELLTPTWAHCLSPESPDIVDGMRADHGWSGCFVAWPPQLIMGMLKTGRRTKWMKDWLDRMSAITLQGPFGQGYWADDMYPTEFGAAAKVFDDHSGCLHWVIGSGANFADMALEWVNGE